MNVQISPLTDDTLEQVFQLVSGIFPSEREQACTGIAAGLYPEKYTDFLAINRTANRRT